MRYSISFFFYLSVIYCITVSINYKSDWQLVGIVILPINLSFPFAIGKALTETTRC